MPEKETLTQQSYFDICTNMEIESVLTAFGALSQESRLKVFRLLVQRGTPGLAAGTIASQLGITPATMSHHLEQLNQAGLVASRREGRSIIYSANYDTMQRLINFLLENCCQGKNDCCSTITSCEEKYDRQASEQKP